MDRDSVKLAPSILGADFARLREHLAEADKAGVNRIHIDVIDGHLLPNISMGASIMQSLRHVTDPPFETHLMISNPDFFLQEFVQAGSDGFLSTGRVTTTCIAPFDESMPKDVVGQKKRE